MPFRYKKKTNRVPASPKRMKKAVEEVIAGAKLRTTATKFDLDKMTLRRYVMKFKDQGEEMKFSPNFKCSQIFNEMEEKNLANYLLNAARMNYGLTTTDTRKLAYMYATENGKKINETWNTNKAASREWLRGFMFRNKDLSLRVPEPTSLSRATAFNKHVVGEFFQLLREVLSRYEFGPDAIYNYDETGVQTVHKPSKIISKKGQKQVSKATSGERGQTVTVCCAINATGNSVPPFLIFPRVRRQDYMIREAPPGSKAVAHPSGWMTSENFQNYLLHFIKFVKCCKDSKILLILDNHISHISPTVLSLCKDNGIVMLTIPPHTSHRLQPLDISVYGPFKMYFNQACDDFMVNNPGQTITLQDIAGLVGSAYKRAITPINIMKGFLKTGISPFDAHIFTDDDFASSSVTDRPEPRENEQTPKTSNHIEPQPGSSGIEHSSEPTANDNSQELTVEEQIPETASIISQESLVEERTPPPLCPHKTPEDIRPLAKAPPRKRRQMGERKRVTTKILTDTPNMIEIKEDFMKREAKQKIKSRVNQVKKNLSIEKVIKTCKKVRLAKKKKEIFEDESDSVSDDVLSTSSEEITDIEDQMDNEFEEQNFCQGVTHVNDYVLVSFRSKKTVRHYVGQVIEIDTGTEECRINFMRRKGLSYHFIYPDVTDESYVPIMDTIKLPPPCFVGGTVRSERKLSFSVNFSKYENVN